MASETDETRFDVRVVKYHIRRGTLSDDDYQKWLDTLPDEAEHGVQTETVFTTPFEDRQKTESGPGAPAEAPSDAGS